MVNSQFPMLKGKYTLFGLARQPLAVSLPLGYNPLKIENWEL